LAAVLKSTPTQSVGYGPCAVEGACSGGASVAADAPSTALPRFAGQDKRGATMMVRKQGDWLAAKVGDELVMMSAEKGNYIGLSEVGARIWELIETPQEVDALCARLQDEYDDVTPEVCRAEVETFLNELVKHGAIALDPPPAA